MFDFLSEMIEWLLTPFIIRHHDSGFVKLIKWCVIAFVASVIAYTLLTIA